jgi:hypothetical protein
MVAEAPNQLTNGDILKISMSQNAKRTGMFAACCVALIAAIVNLYTVFLVGIANNMSQYRPEVYIFMLDIALIIWTMCFIVAKQCILHEEVRVDLLLMTIIFIYLGISHSRQKFDGFDFYGHIAIDLIAVFLLVVAQTFYTTRAALRANSQNC